MSISSPNDRPEQDLMLNGMGLLLDLSHRARHAAGEAELRFMLVNDTHALAPYRQAALWFAGRGVQCLSGVVQIEANAPYAQWLNRICAHLAKQGPARVVRAADVEAEDAAQWDSWLPAVALWLPFSLAGAEGGLLLARDTAWLAREQALLQEWIDSWSHAYYAQTALKKGWLTRWFGTQTQAPRKAPWWRRPAVLWGAALTALACLPVHLSVLAPGELVPANPAVLRAPMDGVIGKIYVQPNQTITAGQTLFSFDETELLSRLDISAQNLATAEAEYRQSAQSAVSDTKYNAQLAGLIGKIEQSRAEKAYWQAALERSRVSAPQAGIVLFGDASEWIGKPVLTGERIMRIARPDDVEIEAWLGVGDAIPLPERAEARLYLNADPLDPVAAQLRYIAHEAVQRPDGSFAYRVRARLNAPSAHRVGLKGTVKLTGRRVPLIYWVARRPLAAVRQSLGW